MMIQLFHNDCLVEMDRLISENIKFDAIIADLPYGTTNCKWDIIIPFDQLWPRLSKLRKDKTPVVLFGSEPFASSLRLSNIDNFKYDWHWIKNKYTNFLNAKKQPLRRVETISVFYNHNYYPQKTEGHKPVNSFTKHTDSEIFNKTTLGFSGGGQTDRYPTNTLFFDVHNNDGSMGERLHPTQKPIDLMKYLVQTYTKVNDLVLDFAAGSGTTIRASKELNRNCIGIEKDKKYYDIAMERIQ